MGYQAVAASFAADAKGIVVGFPESLLKQFADCVKFVPDFGVVLFGYRLFR